MNFSYGTAFYQGVSTDGKTSHFLYSKRKKSRVIK
jgi:hypothetical protein